MKILATAEFDRDLLCAKMSGMTRQMCHSVNDAITDVEGPVIDKRCSNVCKTCLSSLTRGVANAKHGSTIPSTILVMRWTQFSFSFPLPYSFPAGLAGGGLAAAWALDTFHWRRGHVHDTLAVWGPGSPPSETTWPTRRWRSWSAGVSATPAPSWARTPRRWRTWTPRWPWPPATATRPPRRTSTIPSPGRWSNRARTGGLGTRHPRLALYRTLDSPIWEARELNAVGWYSARVGEYEQAFEHCQAALALALRHGHQPSEANMLDSLGYICFHTGRYELAEDYYTRALAVVRDLGHTYLEAETLERLGHTHAARHRHAHARSSGNRPPPVRIATPHRDAARIQRQLDNIGEQDRDALVVDHHAEQRVLAPLHAA